MNQVIIFDGYMSLENLMTWLGNTNANPISIATLRSGGDRDPIIILIYQPGIPKEQAATRKPGYM